MNDKKKAVFFGQPFLVISFSDQGITLSD